MTQPVRFVADLMKPHPRQREALDAVKHHRYVLFGGARGGGKSRWLRWTLLGLLLKWAGQGHKDVRAAIFCEDYPALYDRQLSKLKVEIPPELGVFRSDLREWHLPDNAGVLCFRNLDDPSKYQSAEFAAIGVDELTKNGLEVFNTLRGSLRWPAIEDTRFLAATNPGGTGHLWVRQYWVEGRLPPELEPFRKDFKFVQSLPTDNPSLTDAYWDQLRSLPEGLRKAWVEGSWDMFEGQAFPEWERTVHVVPEFQIPGHWRMACGMDWGMRSKSVLLLCASDDDGNVVVVREWVWRDKDAYEAGYDVATALLYEQLPAWPEYVMADSSMAEPAGIGGTTLLHEFQRGVDDGLKNLNAPHLPVLPAPRGRGSRAQGYNLVRKMLAWGPYRTDKDGKALLDERGRPVLPPTAQPRIRIVGEQCPDLTTSLPALVFDPNNSDDVDTTGDDHAYDALRYYLLGQIPIAQKIVCDIPKDQHPGLLPNGQRRSRHQSDPEVQRTERMLVARIQAERNGQAFKESRYGPHRPR